MVNTKEFIRIMCNHFIQNAERSFCFYGTYVDTEVDDTCQFFESKNFNKDIVDIIFQATAYAISLNLEIYQIKEIKINYPTGCFKTIYLKYVHNAQSFM